MDLNLVGSTNLLIPPCEYCGKPLVFMLDTSENEATIKRYCIHCSYKPAYLKLEDFKTLYEKYQIHPRCKNNCNSKIECFCQNCREWYVTGALLEKKVLIANTLTLQ